MKKYVLIIICTFTFFAPFSPVGLHAFYLADTTEPCSPGIITDLEAYYGFSKNDFWSGHEGELVFGGGINEKLSYLLACGFAYESPEEGDSVTVFGGLGIGLVWNPVDNDSISLDLLPSFTFEPNKLSDDGKNIKPDFKDYSYSIGLELNLKMLSLVQPYVVFGYGDSSIEDEPFVLPLTIGIMYPLSEGRELFLQFDWETNEDTMAWAETSRTLTFGANFVINETIELITGIGADLKIEDENGNEASPFGYGFSIGCVIGI